MVRTLSRGSMGVLPDAKPYTPDRWSSAAAHLSGCDDILVKTAPLLQMVDNWQEFLSGGIETMEAREIEQHERTGRPLGSTKFVAAMEAKLGRLLSRQRPGPKRMTTDN